MKRKQGAKWQRGVPIAAGLLAVWALACVREAAGTGSAILQATAIFGAVGAGLLGLQAYALSTSRNAASTAFWGRVPPILLLGLTAGITLLDGAQRLASAQPPGGDVSLAMAIQAVAGGLAAVALWQLRADDAVAQEAGGSLIVILGAAVAVAAIGGVGLYAWSAGMASADGSAAMAIGLVMVLAALWFCLKLRAVLVHDDRASSHSEAAWAGAGLEVKSLGGNSAGGADARAGHSAAISPPQAGKGGGLPQSKPDVPGQKPPIVARGGKRRGKRR